MEERVEDSIISLAGGPKIPYQVINTDGVDRPRLRFSSDGTLEIRLTDTSFDIDQLLSDHEQWIEEQYTRQLQAIDTITDDYSGLSTGFVLWGQSYEYKTTRGQYAISLQERSLSVSTPADRDPLPFLRNRLIDALRSMIETLADPLTEHFAVTYDQIQIRNQRTKWASCSTNGTLSFNIRCAFLPISHIRYLVAHELAHFEVSDHSPAFWDLVETAIDHPTQASDELEGFWLLVNRNPVWESILETW
jgi:predicted metal-dependent hydrolase